MDGECGVVRGWVYMGNVYVHDWGYMGNGCDRGCRLIENGGWTYWSIREWRKPQTKIIWIHMKYHKYNSHD